AERFLPGRPFSTLKRLCDCPSRSLFLGHGFQGASVLRAPGNSFSLLWHLYLRFNRTSAYSGEHSENKARDLLRSFASSSSVRSYQMATVCFIAVAETNCARSGLRRPVPIP